MGLTTPPIPVIQHPNNKKTPNDRGIGIPSFDVNGMKFFVSFRTEARQSTHMRQ